MVSNGKRNRDNAFNGISQSKRCLDCTSRSRAQVHCKLIADFTLFLILLFIFSRWTLIFYIKSLIQVSIDCY